MSTSPALPTSILLGMAPNMIGGWCTRCDERHELRIDPGPAALALSVWIAALQAPMTDEDRRFRERLQRAGDKKMLAVLVGRDQTGAAQVLRAFSGDLNGHGDVEGCVPSIIRREDTAALEEETLRVVAAMTALIDAGSGPAVAEFRRRRREASRVLMAAMIDATHLCTRGGVRVALRAAFAGGDGGTKIPSGTADCALPKLLHAASVARLSIESVAEASWAPGVDVGERAHGRLASPCAPRCLPLLGSLLCPCPSTSAPSLRPETNTTTGGL